MRMPHKRHDIVRTRPAIAALAAALLVAACGVDPAADLSATRAAGPVPAAAGTATGPAPGSSATPVDPGAAPAEVADGPAEVADAPADVQEPAQEEEPLAAVDDAPADMEEAAPPADPAATLAFTLAPAGADPAPVAELEIATTPSVFIVADWTNVTPDLAQRLDVFEPGGSLYYSTVIPFAGTQRGDATVSLTADGSCRVRFTLEIQGTPIEWYQMAGGWRATVSLAGTRAPPAAAATVVLR
jgi:hypothetical protein